MTSSCSSRQSRCARRGRLLSGAFIILGGCAFLINAAAAVRAQQAPTADLTVSKSGDEAASVGGQITYNISVYNGGPDTATNVVLTDPIPAHTSYVSADSPFPRPDDPSPPPPGIVSFSNNTLTVTFDSIPAFEARSVRLIVQVNPDTPRGTTVSNTVTGTSNATDPQTFDNTATALTVITGPFAGDILISEFRLRGPAGAADEYIEIYNNTDTPQAVQATDGSGGYSVAASDGVIRCTIPNGTILPRRGHYLCVNSVGYSLGLHPAGEGEVPTATGDVTYETDIPDNAGIAIFRTSDPKNFNLTNRLDAAGSANETNALYKEGTGYPALSPSGLDYALYRDNCGKAGSVTVFGNCPTGGEAKDSDNNAVDFIFVEPNGNTGGAAARLGAPGPENFAGPIQRNVSFGFNLLDPCVGASSAPNRVRNFTVDQANNSVFGTLDIRRTVINGTGENVTRLRWRIIDITTYPAPSGIADLRARSSTPVVVTVDGAPCGSETSDVIVEGTTLEQPPVQTNGGGFNSSLTSGTITLQTPLTDGESINVRFLLGIMQTGNFKFFINVEALTHEPVQPDPEPEAAPRPSVRPRKGTQMQPAQSSPARAQPAAASPARVTTPRASARDRVRHDF